MKTLVRITAGALLAGAVTWATGTAWGALAAGDLACQKAIQKDTIAYVNNLGIAAWTMINVSQAGKGNAAPVNICMSGPNVGKKCIGNNGGCHKALVPCNADADCQALPGFSTDTCDFTKGCTPMAPWDANECQPMTNAGVSKAQTKLLTDMTAKCSGASLDNIGLTHMTDCMIGTCAGGTNNAAACNEDNGPAVCSGGGSCDFTNAIANLASCIEASADGDFGTGKIVDTILRPLAKMTGTGSAVNAEGLHTDPLPRELIQFNGSEWLAIGTVAGSEAGTQAGAVQYLSLATCNLGNEAKLCLNNKDCVGGTCTRNPQYCVNTILNPSPTACTSDADCASNDSCGSELTGTQVHKCCSGSITTSCATNADCGVGTCGYTGCYGNILSVTQTSSNGSTTCLVTHTGNSGNGTTTTGAINLTTGQAVTQSPIATDVYLLGPGVTGCGRCVNHVCDTNSTNAGAACTGADGQIDQGCFPAGGNLGTIPNPFILTTGTRTMTPGAAPNKFCGFCNAAPAIGCQTAADCPSGTCNFTGTNNGFYGDSTATTVTATGDVQQYAPTFVGVFCTGKTSSSLVNGSAGLPGPVRIIQPYVFGYSYSKD
jgi:hypothetical protein